MTKPRKMQFTAVVPNYGDYQTPHGFLQPDRACLALFHYATLVRKAYEQDKDTIKYEDEPDNLPNYHQLFKSCAMMYGVEPEAMLHFWPNVKLQFATMRLPMVPDFARFESVPVIVTKS